MREKRYNRLGDGGVHIYNLEVAILDSCHEPKIGSDINIRRSISLNHLHHSCESLISVPAPAPVIGVLIVPSSLTQIAKWNMAV